MIVIDVDCRQVMICNLMACSRVYLFYLSFIWIAPIYEISFILDKYNTVLSLTGSLLCYANTSKPKGTSFSIGPQNGVLFYKDNDSLLLIFSIVQGYFFFCNLSRL